MSDTPEPFDPFIEYRTAIVRLTFNTGTGSAPIMEQLTLRGAYGKVWGEVFGSFNELTVQGPRDEQGNRYPAAFEPFRIHPINSEIWGNIQFGDHNDNTGEWVQHGILVDTLTLPSVFNDEDESTNYSFSLVGIEGEAVDAKIPEQANK